MKVNQTLSFNKILDLPAPDFSSFFKSFEIPWNKEKDENNNYQINLFKFEKYRGGLLGLLVIRND